MCTLNSKDPHKPEKIRVDPRCRLGQWTPPPCGHAKWVPLVFRVFSAVFLWFSRWVPFVLWRFFPSFIAIFGPIWGQSMCGETSCGVVTFSLVLKAFQVVLGSWSPEFTICPFQARKWPFQAPQTLRFKGKMANFEAKKHYKTGKKTPKRTNGTHFTRVPPPLQPESYRIFCPEFRGGINLVAQCETPPDLPFLVLF